MIHTKLIILLSSSRILMLLNFLSNGRLFSLWFNMETRLNQGNVKKKEQVPDLQIYTLRCCLAMGIIA